MSKTRGYLDDLKDNFRVLFNVISDPAYLWQIINDDLILIDYNVAASNFTEGNIKNYVGVKASKFFIDDPETFKALRQSAIERTSNYKEVKYKYKTINAERFLSVNFGFIDPDIILVQTKDITEKKLAEQKLRESEEKFRTLAEQSFLGIAILQDNLIKYVNKQLADIFGYSIDEAMKWNAGEFLNVIHPEDRQFVAKQAMKKQTGQQDIEKQYQFRGIKKNGDVIWLDVFSKTINYGDKTADFVTILDDTDRKKVEESLRKSEEKSRLIIENAHDIIYILNKNYKFEYFNEKVVENLLGYTRQELIGESPLKYLHPDDIQRVIEGLSRGFQKGEGRIEVRFKDKGNNYHWFEAQGKTFRDIDGDIKSLTIARDMTERKLSEQKLVESEQKYREAYDRANFYKDLFAHDIRNVLQIVSSSVELISYQLENSQKSKEIDMIISMIKNQVLRANRMIKNVNILSELEKIDISIEIVELLEFLKNSINFVKVAYKDRIIEIKFESFSNRVFIKANELLQDIFDNILINAVRYNDNSVVEIFIKISREQKEGKNYIRMEFIDNGVGIVDERKEIIFEKGFREHKGQKGMGLGLFLVKKIVSSYNGIIRVEDRIKGDYSKGSNFILTLLESVE